MWQQLQQKIVNRRANVGVIGLGYVGLPLAVEFAKAGFTVTGIEVDRHRATSIAAGRSYIPDVPTGELAGLVKAGRLRATGDFKALAKTDAVIICVPTPLRKTREPDISFILAAAEQVAQTTHPGQAIVLESTTYPGTTEETILPKMVAKGLKVGQDFFLAFSPERIDPGNQRFTTKNIPKVVGGVTKRCTQIVRLLYSQVIDTVIPVSSPKAAEMVKLLENTFRSVNIGLVNEIALVCDRFDLDVWEVIDAARTKPFGFMAFYPGPGLGGHCLPSDPIYLSWKARMHGFEARFIELAAQVNGYMPQHVVGKVIEGLNEHSRALKGSRVLVLGVAYKKDVNDTRDAPSIEIISMLRKKGAVVSYHDPFIPRFLVGGKPVPHVKLTAPVLQHHDIAVIVSEHSSVDYPFVVRHIPQIIDTRNVLKMIRSPKIIKL